MLKIKYLALSIFLLGCFSKKEEQVFESLNFTTWMSATKVDILLPKLMGNIAPISRPAAAWLGLARITFLSENADSLKSECLFYQVPSKKTPGILRVIEASNFDPCRDYRPNGRAHHDLIGVDLLKFFFPKERVRIDENKFLSKNHLHLNFKYKGIEKWMSFPLLNLKQAEKFKRYDNSAEQKYYKGITFWPMSENLIDLKTNKKIEYLGDLKDSYLDRKTNICHQVGKGCLDISPNNCDQCKFGWYEVVDYRCPQGGSKYCSPNHCGKKGEPACPRGFDHLSLVTDIVQEDICFQDSPYGICERGLRTYCDENHILICL